MSKIRRHTRILLVAVCCVAVGAGVSAIAGAGAATTSSSHPASKAGAKAGAKRAKRAGGLRRLALRAVHGDVVVHTKAGFSTVTFDRGKVDSVNGQQLTITEGTAKSSYKTVTLTVPANAIVRDNQSKSTLSAVKPGQRVLVLAAPQHTYVIARTPKQTARTRTRNG
jgi:hypothetical protein